MDIFVGDDNNRRAFTKEFYGLGTCTQHPHALHLCPSTPFDLGRDEVVPFFYKRVSSNSIERRKGQGSSIIMRLLLLFVTCPSFIISYAQAGRI